MYLVLKMSVDDYANWIYLFQFVLLSSSGLGAIINTEFSKKYKQDDYQNLILSVYIGSMDIYVFIIVIFALILFLSSYGLFILFSVILLFLLNIFYNYVLLALRFTCKYNYLVLLSVLRLFSFLPILLISNISLEYLFSMMIISFAIPIIWVYYKFRIVTRKYKTTKEIFWLLSYGLSTSLFITFERFFLKFIEIETKQYATIVYLVTLVMILVPLVEVVKQYLVPELYIKYRDKSYSLFRDYRVLKFIAALFVIQTIIPGFIYKILSDLNALPMFMQEFSYINLVALSLGFAIFSIYHFINPAFFLFNGSKYLLLSQILGIMLFLLLFSLTRSFYISKLVALSSVVVVTLVYSRKLNIRHV